MNEMEKVIKELEDIQKHLDTRYSCVISWESELIRDALAMLKDPDRIKVIRCKDCIFFEPFNAEEGDSSGYCRNDYAPCQNQTVDAWWFCGSGRKV